MFRYLPIRRVHAREVLDSRGNPTIEVEVTVGESITGLNGSVGRAIVPSGASTGEHEAIELRDQEERYHGMGVRQAVFNVNTLLSDILVGENALRQREIDELLLKEDGTENKARIGANAILGVSMAVAKAAASAVRIPLYQYLGGCMAHKMPVPLMNIINGGCHSKNSIDFQEFMIMPIGQESFSERLRVGTEVYHALKIILNQNNKSTAVGDEGGFAPDLKDCFEVFEYLCKAVEKAGYQIGEDVAFAMDAAASELYQADAGMYYFPGESENLKVGIQTPDTRRCAVLRNTEEMIELYKKLCDKYPIYSIEDGLDQNDWDGWKNLTQKLGDRVQLVGDDLFVTNKKLLQKGIRLGCANAILVKLNQIGTLTEALDAVVMAQNAGYRAVISHRSGESEDTFIADLAVATNAGQIKTGAPCRAERTAKYNQLLRIEEK